MRPRARHIVSTIVLLAAITLSGATVLADETNYSVADVVSSQQVIQPVSGQGDKGDYTCRLRIYVVEPFSRFVDASAAHYDFGFLDFMYNSEITLAYQESLTDTVTWDASGTDFDDITEGNIMAIAVAFSNEGQRSFSVPPDSFPFDAFYVEATAAATTTEQWSNATSEPGFTHTVFVEEGTSQTCGYCPRTRQALFAIHTFDSYPFFYAAMVTQNPKASARLSEHDMYYVPTCYFDDGYEVYVGGNTDQSVYSSRIISSGARDVHDLDLEISLNWLGGAEIEAIFTITNNELINEPPDIPSTPGGVSEGTVSTDYQFTATTTDPDANAVYYKWDWGNGEESDWLGPYNSGETCEATYQWADAGTYDVTVKAKDEWDAECDWSSALTVDIAAAYMCGDANDDEAINLLDILYLISYIYGTPQGPPPNPMEAGDANADGDINLLDILYLIDHVYGSPPGPAPQCP